MTAKELAHLIQERDVSNGLDKLVEQCKQNSTGLPHALATMSFYVALMNANNHDYIALLLAEAIVRLAELEGKEAFSE